MTYSGTYDLHLVVISIIVAIMTYFACFNIVNQIRTSNKSAIVRWIIGGSLTLGLGIWSMHFIGMLGFDAHVLITYHVGQIILSFVLACVGGFIAFFTCYQSKKSLLISTVLSGFIFIGMHSRGMKAMEMEANMDYDIGLISLSIIMVFFVSGWASFLFSSQKNNQSKPFGRVVFHSIVLGLGTASAHYTAMEAVMIEGTPSHNYARKLADFDILSNQISTDILAYFLCIAVIIILGLIISLAYLDKYRAEQHQKVISAQYKSLVDHNPNIVFTVDHNGLITDVNPKGIEISKFTREAITTKSVVSFFRAEDQPMVEYKLLHIQEAQQDFEAPILNGEGTWVPMLITLVPIIIDEKMLGAFVVARDNTDLFKSKEHIRKAQKDLYNTIRKQQGLTYKFIKVGERFIHTLCEGEIIYRVGLSPLAVVGKEVHDFFSKEEAEYRLHVYEKAWQGEITSYEGNINGVDYYVTLSPIIEDGKIMEVVASGVDITPLKEAEKYHKKQETWYRNILSEMSEGIMLYGADDRIVPFNDNVHRLFGLTKEELQEQTIYNNIINFVREDGTPLELEKYPIYQTLTTGNMVTGEIIGIKHQEHTTWVSMNTKLLESLENDQGPKVLFTMTDITKQKEQEIMLREVNALNSTIMNSLPLGMIMIDNNYHIMALNKPFCTMFNLKDSLSDFIGENIEQYREGIYKNTEWEVERVKDIYSRKKPNVDEVELPDKRILERRYFPFYMDGELKGHLWTFEEISERKQMERGIIQSKEEAVKANLIKSEFLSKMSHELRTPLNGILGFAQLLELDTTLSKQQQDFVQEILIGGRHLLNLINEVLDLSRIETGKIKISNEPIEIQTVLNECINLISSAADKKNIHVINKLDECTDICVKIDQVRIRQVILNLLDNAIKYNNKNGEMMITCEVKKHNVFIHVIDNGFGISDAEQQQIFEPFYRGEHPHIEGTGIGLSLVRQLIHLMGGEVGVESRIGEGSDFWFSLPILSSLYVKQIHSLDNHGIAPLSYEKRVLYIEDNFANLQLVSEILQTINGITLLSAMRGDEGIQVALDQLPDLILLDLHLPDMHGFDVFEQLKANQRTAQIPVIALSANAMLDDIQLALRKGFEEYITKPIEVQSFLRKISTYLTESI
ncbi:PAS domain S-box protein [Robertmurraya massiliosenegalensis]|uniref:PAS domain S-box protein n=1 Tax=Robertmurraya TaxID=2837507 RepID=UPI0039A55ACA